MTIIRSTVPPHILEMDRNDKLAGKRSEFQLDQNCIYLDGNSLGPLAKRSQARLEQVVAQEWGADLISSWNKHSWIDMPSMVGEKIANLIGASAGQVICCDSISVNLFKVLASALHINSGRKKILSLSGNFPTDLYMAQGLSTLLGEDRSQLIQVTEDQLSNSIDESVAVLMLTQVDFRSGEILDIAKITELAHQNGVIVVWDLAHSAGAVPIQLDDWKVDFAVGCGYKYLNGGPGAPAFIYAARCHHKHIQQPLNGWMGHAKPFDFSTDYSPMPGIKQFLAGTPNILSLAALDGALDVYAEISIEDLYVKSKRLSSLFIEMVDSSLLLNELLLVSPRKSWQRGSHIAYAHSDGFAITQALIAQQVIIDFRAPNILRFGFAPLYTSFSDIYHAVGILEAVFEQQSFKQEQYQVRNTVT